MKIKAIGTRASKRKVRVRKDMVIEVGGQPIMWATLAVHSWALKKKQQSLGPPQIH